jgi:hypothetical protein
MLEKVAEKLQSVIDSEDSDENKEYKIKQILNIK